MKAARKEQRKQKECIERKRGIRKDRKKAFKI
jgi:hypothetical protein